MTLSRFILMFLQFLCTALVESMKVYESSGNVDSDGIPLDAEWEKQSFLLAIIRSGIKDYNKAFEDYENK